MAQKAKPEAVTMEGARLAFESCRAVFGAAPKNVIFPIKVGAEVAGWLAALFQVIETLNADGDRAVNAVLIQQLASLGAYVASDMSESTLGGAYERLLGQIEAAEGGAA